MSSKEKTMFLCRLALLTAAYFVLSITLTVKTPYLEILSLIHISEPTRP